MEKSQLIVQFAKGNRKVLYITKKVDKNFLRELYECGLDVRDFAIYDRKLKEYAPFTICPNYLKNEIDTSVFDMIVCDESIKKNVISADILLTELQ